LDGTGSVGAGHLHEPEAARTPGVPIVDEGHGLDSAVLREQFANSRFVCGEGQVAHVNLTHLKKLTDDCSGAADRRTKHRFQSARSTEPGSFPDRRAEATWF